MTKPWHWWTLAFGLYGLFVFVMFALVPHEVAQTPAAIAFADFMAQFVPMLDQIKKIRGFEPFMRFYYSVLWLCTPVASLIGWMLGKCIFIKRCEAIRKYSVARMWGSVSIFVLVHPIYMYWPVDSGYQSWRDTGVVSGYLGIAHFTLMVWLLWICTVVILVISIERTRMKIQTKGVSVI